MSDEISQAIQIIRLEFDGLRFGMDVTGGTVKQAKNLAVFIYALLTREKIQGKTITFVMEMEDQPGLLSSILKIVADCKANILSIHQSIPVNHIALITLSVMILPITEDVAVLFDRIENADGINNLKIVSEE